MGWDRHAWDHELGRRDRAEELDEPPPKPRPERRHARLCYTEDGQLDCVCQGSVQWADHPDWGKR